ncbi:hypothetical protein [Desulfovulcanus sp.]
MQKIPINLAQPGMILEKPVLRPNGLVIVGEGAELNENLIKRLQDMGIKDLVVQGEPLDLEGMVGSTSYAKRIERLDYLFRNFNEDSWMKKVKAFLKSYYERKAASQL